MLRMDRRWSGLGLQRFPLSRSLNALVVANNLHGDGNRNLRARAAMLDKYGEGDLGRMRGRDSDEPGVVTREKCTELRVILLLCNVARLRRPRFARYVQR
jgi:hypothetical protein